MDISLINFRKKSTPEPRAISRKNKGGRSPLLPRRPLAESAGVSVSASRLRPSANSESALSSTASQLEGTFSQDESDLVSWTASWRCHDMEMLSELLALCEGNPPVTGWKVSSRKGLIMQSCAVFYDFSWNKLWNKQLSCQWFEMPWRSCGVTVMCCAFQRCSVWNMHTALCCLFCCGCILVLCGFMWSCYSKTLI